MGKRPSMPEHIRARLAAESGFAMPATVLFLMAVLGLAGAMVLSSIAAQHGTTRDQSLKAAIAAADAGAQTAIYRANQGDALLTDALPCVHPGGSGLSATAKLTSGSATGWCAAEAGTVGSATYSYRVFPQSSISGSANTKSIQVVSTGTANGISRRIAVTAIKPTGSPSLFQGNYAMVGDTSLTVEGNAVVNGLFSTISVASNQDVNLRTSTADLAQLCSSTQHGTNGALNITTSIGSIAGNQCLNPPFSFANTTGYFPMSPVDQGNVTTTNNNANLASARCLLCNGSYWTAGTRTLNLSSGVLSLPGGNYSLCKLTLSGTAQIAALSGSEVRLYFDDPSTCGLASGTNQVSITGASSIISLSLLPLPNTLVGLVSPPPVAMFVYGSDTVATNVDIEPTVGINNALVVWAPRSAVTLGGVGVYDGAFAGKTVDVKGTAVVNFDGRAANLAASEVPVFHRSRYVECTGSNPPTGGAPGANC